MVSTDAVCCVFVLLSLGLRLYGLGRGARRTLGRRWTLDGGVCTFVVCIVDALPSLQFVSMCLWLAVSVVWCGVVRCGASGSVCGLCAAMGGSRVGERAHHGPAVCVSVCLCSCVVVFGSGVL